MIFHQIVKIYLVRDTVKNEDATTIPFSYFAARRLHYKPRPYQANCYQYESANNNFALLLVVFRQVKKTGNYFSRTGSLAIFDLRLKQEIATGHKTDEKRYERKMLF